MSEISNSKFRGILGSIFLLTVNFGTLVMFIFGSYLSYSFTANFMLSLPILFAIIFLFFPETPYYLLKCGKTKKAENSLKFLHGCRKITDTPERLKSELLVIAKKVEDDSRTRSKVAISKELSE